MDELQINRRQFIRTATALGVYGTMANSSIAAFAKEQEVKLTILHTNDWHSRIEAFPMDGGPYQGKGGAAARAALIAKIRMEEKNVLLLDAGDIFQGTPYFNFYGGEIEYKLMTQMGYDLATLGNHDFDNGIDGIVKQLPHAGFEFVNCNYDFGNTPLAKYVKPYKIINKSGIKIGIMGVGIVLAGLVPEKNYTGISYNDPVSCANKIAKELKVKQKCDLIICLSHLGYKYHGAKISDIALAKQSEHIDLIIGGHTHTFLTQPDLIKNKVDNEVMVNQVGWAGINLGRIDYIFNLHKNKAMAGKKSVLDVV